MRRNFTKSYPAAMSTNKSIHGLGERQFLDLEALAQCMEAIPILVKDVKTFDQKADDGNTAHV